MHGHRVALRDFVVAGDKDRTAHEEKNGLWFVDEGTLPTYTMDEVVTGLESHKDVLVRTQIINEEGEKTVLSREESLSQIKTNGVAVVEGANLHVNEYGSPLFADFFFFITGFHGFHVFSGVVLNIIIFFYVMNCITNCFYLWNCFSEINGSNKIIFCCITIFLFLMIIV